MSVMNKLMNTKLNKKGFTLAELLIVVAIIAVLVAVSIPIFTSQLEKSREATDAANLRAAYANASVKVLETESGVSAGPVAISQKTKGWQNTSIIDIAGIKTTHDSLKDIATAAGETYYVNVSAEGVVTVTTAAAPGFTVIDPVTGQ